MDENGISPIQEQDLLTNELNEEMAGEQESDDDNDDEELVCTCLYAKQLCYKISCMVSGYYL